MSSSLKLVVVLFLSLFLGACASGPREQASAADSRSSTATAASTWELRGTRIIGCCCTAPCPCRINKKPTHCHGCHFTEAIHIDSGNIDGVSMAGMDWVIVGKGFGEAQPDNWSTLYVSDRASEAQLAALDKLMQGMVAGLGVKAPHLVGNSLGMHKAKIAYQRSADSRDIGFQVGDVLQFKSRAIYNPGRNEPVVSTGILDSYGDRFIHAEALVHKLNDPAINRSFDLTGRQANQADFVLSSARVAKGGIGWGCWSAHKEFGDTQPYPEQAIGHECSDCKK